MENPHFSVEFYSHLIHLSLKGLEFSSTSHLFLQMFMMLKVWDSVYWFWLAGVFKVIIIFKRSYLLRTDFKCHCFYPYYLPNKKLLHFPQGSPTGPVKNFTPTATYLSVCMYLHLQISPFSTLAATYCHLQTCPQDPLGKPNRLFSCPSCQSISVI